MAKKKKSAFSGKISKSVSQQKAKGSAYGYLNLPSGINVWSPKPGSKKVLIDIMPYTITDNNHPDKVEGSEIAMKGDVWYKRPFAIHRQIGTDNETVVCLKSFGKKCPICEERDRLFKEGANKDDTDAVKSSKRNLYIVVPLNSDKHEKVPHLFDMSEFLFQKYLNDELEEDETNEIFPDLEQGLTLNLRFSSEVIGEGKPYAECSRIDFEKREEQYTEKIMKKIPDVDAMLQEMTYDKLNNLFREIPEESDDVPTEKETRKKKTKDSKKKTKDSKKKKKKKKKDKVLECPEGWEFGTDFMKKKKVCKKCKFNKECQEISDLPF